MGLNLRCIEHGDRGLVQIREMRISYASQDFTSKKWDIRLLTVGIKEGARPNASPFFWGFIGVFKSQKESGLAGFLDSPETFLGTIYDWSLLEVRGWRRYKLQKQVQQATKWQLPSQAILVIRLSN